MAENHVLIRTINLTTSTASVTFDNIPQTGFTDLAIYASLKSNGADYDDYIKLQLNGNNPTTIKNLYGSGTGAGSNSANHAGATTGSGGSTSDTFGNGFIYVPNYTSTNQKQVSADGVGENNNTVSLSMFSAPLFNVTSAVTSITLIPFLGTAWVKNSTVSLYGIAAEGTTPVSPTAPKATGGNIVISDNTYWYHIFTSSGTFAPSATTSCDYVVIAGGGSGGSCPAGYNVGSGGGGAGGLRQTSSTVSFAAGSYAVTIGAGATAPAVGSGSYGNDGSTSSLIGGAISISATGGGGGAPTQNVGRPGGSGGGAAQNYSGGSGNAGGYTPSEGNDGGRGQNGDPQFNGGGGGGAGGGGGTGVYGAPYTAGAGGIGATSSLLTTIAQTTGLGDSGYFAGGGAGGTYAGSTVAVGGTGGGGNGNAGSTAATSGKVSTGGGGGGDGGGVRGPGNGGSGIVVIRYAMA